MNKKKMKKLSAITFLITTILLIIITSYYKYQISQINKELNTLERQNQIKDWNIISDSLQRTKISSTHAHYNILKELNSSKSEEFDLKLKEQIIQLINILSNGNVSPKDLHKRNIDELQVMVDNLSTNYATSYNSNLKIINNLKSKKESKEAMRDSWILIIGFFQSLGLFIGYWAR